VRIPVISTVVPWPPITGNRMRAFHLRRAVAAVADVTPGCCLSEEDSGLAGEGVVKMLLSDAIRKGAEQRPQTRMGGDP
jgi:hypothetical protein